MTMTTTAVAEQRFMPPGPGVWMLDATHWTRPLTRFQVELFPDPFRRGFGESLRRYGSLLAYLDVGFANGFAYYRPRPVGAPEGSDGHPPREVWDELAAGHPEIRERLATSAHVFERKLWRQDLERWDREVKPAAVRAHLELLAVDPHALDADGLLAYLERCRENQVESAYIHHLFNVPALLPIGDFLVHAHEWTGRPPAELLSLLSGSSPDPLGAADELQRLVVALRRDRAARELLATPAEPAEVVAALRSLQGEAGTLAAVYVDRVGYRPVNGEDVGEPSVHELPELVVAAIRSALDAVAFGAEADELDSRTSEVRADVPGEHRPAFDDLLAESRAVARLRDERGSYADLWAIGIMRRAILAAAARLAASGRIADPVHLAEAGSEELRVLVASGDGPAAEELAARARYRLQARYADAPPFLGGEPAPPLPPEWLPPAASRLERAIGAVVAEMLFSPQPQTEERKVRGVGVSPGIYEGTARVIHSSEEFGRIERGEVLVTNSTTTAFNIVLPLLGAIVTDRGGLLSHAAIVAREYGIPAVVGCSDATAVVADGDRVRVDGRAGEVEVVR
jgi:rifampicin phosphotransferase